MFKTLFQQRRQPPVEWSLSAIDSLVRSGFPTAEEVALQLSRSSARMSLSLAQARLVVAHMQPQHIAQGIVFIQEGDETHTDCLFLVLRGEVIVEAVEYTREDLMTVTVLGAGSVLGELALLDGLPRSVSCTASTEVYFATLDRPGLQALLEEHPEVGAKLVMSLSLRMAERLRDITVKLKKYVQLTRMLQDELDPPQRRGR